MNVQKPAASFSKTKKRKPGKLTLAAYSRIVNWWHPSKNDNKTPKHCSHGSRKRVWLQCHGCPDCGEVHEWDAAARDLTQYGDNMVCPYCESRGGGRFCSCRSVAANARLAAEWHEDNPALSQIAMGRYKKHKWRCSNADCGHIWEASPASRSSLGRSCPECRKGNWKGMHISLAEGRPDLLPEWDEWRNGRPATGVTCGSGLKAWWVCEKCGGSWQATVANRATSGKGFHNCKELNRLQPRKFLRI
jgi:hypothetical protein